MVSVAGIKNRLLGVKALSKVKYKRVINKPLSFTGIPLLQERHKLHTYPAMIHPLLVDHLLDELAVSGNIVFDPFCGSGVVPVQASVNGYKTIGFDINPMALLITKAKLAKYNIKTLLKEAADLIEKARKSKEIDIPEIKNMDYWYEKSVAVDLGKIRHTLINNNYQYRDFLLVIFAFVCRDQSLTRKGEFKRYRKSEADLTDSKNEVFSKFISHIDKMIDVFESAPVPKKNCAIHLANSENPMSKNISFDIVITSPPYGDSKTTVAYGQFSSFGIDWIKDLNPFGQATGNDVDRLGLGVKGEINKNLSNHKVLQNILDRIGESDEKRAGDVLHFFNGYYNSIQNTASKLRDGGKVCYVVGNRTVKGHQIPMDQITASFFEESGLRFNDILVRQISSKVMPLRNSPTNVSGTTAKTMTEEYIVLLQK